MQLELVNTDLSVNDISLTPIIYKETPCISTEMLAKAYGVDAGQIRKNLAANKDRFTAGKHFYLLQGEELDALRNLQVENLGSQNLQATFGNFQISPMARHFTLWTERGAARHAKMLNSDKAWDVFEMLEETFFNQPTAPAAPLPAPSPAPAPADAPLTPEQQCTLHDIVRGKVQAATGNDKYKGGLYPQIWSRFNNHFRVAKYSQLPQCRLSEAIEYLMRLDVQEVKASIGQAALANPAALSADEREKALRQVFDRFSDAFRAFSDEVSKIDKDYVRLTAKPAQEAAQRMGNGRQACSFEAEYIIDLLHAHERQFAHAMLAKMQDALTRARQTAIAVNRLLYA